MYVAARRLGLLIGAVALAACGSDSNGPTSDARPVGYYQATQFVTTGSAGPTNQLLNGATLQITLSSDATTAGHLHIPAQGSTPALDEDMTGTWAVSANNVKFTQSADTFMNDLAFEIQPVSTSSWDLVADQVVNGVRIQLTLQKLNLVALAIGVPPGA